MTTRYLSLPIRFAVVLIAILCNVFFVESVQVRCQRNLKRIERGRVCRKHCESDADCRAINKRCVCDDYCGLSCHNPNAMCNPLSLITNGHFSGRNSYRKIVTYTCNKGFHLQGSRTRRCRSDRKWSGIQPKCVDYRICGQSNEQATEYSYLIGRLVNGERANAASWPWQVLISRIPNYLPVNHSYDFYNEYMIGGGSLISKTWILTAAHLFLNVPKLGKWEKQFFLTLGMHRRVIDYQQYLSSRVKVFRSEKIFIHPNFSFYDNDIAMIKIGWQYIENVQHEFVKTENFGLSSYTQHIRSVCLPCMNSKRMKRILKEHRRLTGVETNEELCEFEGNILLQESNENNTIITGFGHTRSRNYGDFPEYIFSQYLQQANLKFRSNDYCRNFTNNRIPWRELDNVPEYYPLIDRTKINFTENMLCGNGIGSNNTNADACQGDSGGPVVRKVILDRNESYWIQIGMVSWGWGCGQRVENPRELIPGYYTNVIKLTSWISSVIRSNVILCNVTAIPNGRALTNASTIKVEDEVTYTCNIGYEMPDLIAKFPTVVCQENSSLSFVPVCHPVLCQIPFVPPNGRIILRGPTHFGRTISYECDYGYQLIGESSPICQSDQLWSSPVPQCIEIHCSLDDIDDIDLYSISPGKKIFLVNENLTYECIENYRVRNQPGNRQKIVTCLDENKVGSWSDDPPHCEYNGCSIPSVIEHGNIETSSNQVLIGSEIRISCDVEYQISGSSTLRCVNVNTWSQPVPSCVSNDPCYSSPCHNGGTCTMIDRQSFSCSCVNGYTGNRCENGLWSGWSNWSGCSQTCDGRRRKRRTCLSDACPGLDVAVELCGAACSDDPCNSSPCRNRGTCTMIDRQRFSCSCSYGYTGNRCENEISCMVPARPTHGTKSPQSNEVPLNSMVMYRCNEGFMFRGRSTDFIRVTCEESGQVSEGIPPCMERNPCDSFPCQNGGTCLRFNGQSYQCTCEAGFTGRTCDNEIRCVLPAQPIHGTKSHESEDVSINTEVTYRCNQGFMFDGTSTRVIRVTCEESGEVPDEIPPCVGLWNGWSNWSGCSQTCDGRRRKTRTCPSDACPGSKFLVEPCGAACPLEAGSGIKKFGLYTEMVNFNEAIRRCGQLFNGTLAQVKSRQETQAIIRLLNQRKTTRSHFVYFGIRRDERNNWTYLDGTPVPANNRRPNQEINYRNWFWNEPNNVGGNENCGSFFARRNHNVGKWADSRCDRNRNFVCETVIGCTVPALLSSRISLDPSYYVRTRRVGKSVTYQCADDYVISGTDQSSLKVTCLSPKRWSHNELTCEEFNPCNSSPCQNGGTCNRNGRRGYYCTCVNHVFGNVCQTIQNPCFSSPCQNGGTCSRIRNEQYLCDCPPKYAGDRCHLRSCTAPQVSRVLEIANANDDNKYATGDTLRLRCRNQAEFISIRRGIITCIEGNTWSPILSIIRCI